MAACINQCSGHGICLGGFCQCDNGWYGIDCSLPSPLSLVSQEWPLWLPASSIDRSVPANDPTSHEYVNLVMKRRRPLIYVYDLPAELNAQIVEGRHHKEVCVDRIYNEANRTIWTDYLHAAQMALHESLLASHHRTSNPEQADYFYVPVDDACIILRAGDAPHFRDTEKSVMGLEIYKKAHDYIVHKHPFWNRTYGRDHIWVRQQISNSAMTRDFVCSFAYDDGACFAPQEIWNSTMLVHWGKTNLTRIEPFPGHYLEHSCFDPNKDIIIPAWKAPGQLVTYNKTWRRVRSREERTTLFYFNGNLGAAYDEGYPESFYSMGIRQKIAEEFGTVPNKVGMVGRQRSRDVVVTPLRSPKYYDEISRSLFCGVFPGFGWSGRLEDSVLNGCIPVIIQDEIFLPYENILDYSSFTIRIPEVDIPNMISILRRINETEIDSKLRNIQTLRQRFLFRDSILLEAERQKKMFGTEARWSAVVSKIMGDDMFSTLIQVLHFKLHNDPWRLQVQSPQKDFGLPEECWRG